jgi:NAD(P)-dependent dehydrogenase (short-subunit alcohol dehydrogenase family)
VRETARELVKRFGRIDVLVNNAGLAFMAPASEYREFERSVAVNLGGAFNWSQAVAVESMIPNRSGAIVNISSLAGLAAHPGDVGYIASKHGVIGLTKALALEWAEFGIRVNCVAPGITSSPTMRRVIDAEPIFMAERIARVPIGRVGQPEDQAQAILFLASDAAAYISGVTLPVDGGQMAMQSGYSRKR